jgi:hypothetical protein
MKAASFRRTLFLTRVPKGTGRFLMRRLASLIYFAFTSKKKAVNGRSRNLKTTVLIPTFKAVIG